MIKEYDIVIVGAGPSGCASALALKDSGLNIVLIDKELFPREKTCGDAIPGNAFKAIKHLNKSWYNKLKSISLNSFVHSAKAHSPKGKSVIIKWKLFASNIKRKDFDNFLINLVKEKTNIDILQNFNLTEIHKETNHITCTFNNNSQIRAKLIIGCDGTNSKVKKYLSPINANKLTATAVRGYFENVKGIELGVNEFYFFKEYIPGYLWIFPINNNTANVGFGVVNSNNNNIKNTFNSIINNNSIISQRFKDAILVSNIKGGVENFGNKKLQISGERFILCGDAASLISPLGGDGIDKALWSGIYAAKQAIQCFTENNFTEKFMNQYDISIYNKVGKDFKLHTIAIKNAKIFMFIVEPAFYILNRSKTITKIFKNIIKA